MCKVRSPLREGPPNLLNISSNKRIVDSLLCCTDALSKSEALLFPVNSD